MSDAPGRLRRYSFTLRGLLLFLLIVVLAGSHFWTSRRLYEARQTIRALRNEQGLLDVQDRNQVHVIALDTGDPDQWQWRVFLPRGARYKWNIAGREIPKRGTPRAGISGISNDPYWERENEILVTARLKRADEGTWLLSVSSRSGENGGGIGGTTLRISDEDVKWMREIPSSERGQLGSRGTVAVEPVKPIELLRIRACAPNAAGDYEPSDQPQPGFMIWLDRF